MTELKGEWMIRRILKTEIRKDSAGKDVKYALVDWENSWIPRAELSNGTEKILLNDHVKVLGPIEDNRMRMQNIQNEWAIEIKHENGTSEKQRLPYKELNERFPGSLLKYYETLVQSSMRNIRLMQQKKSLREKEQKLKQHTEISSTSSTSLNIGSSVDLSIKSKESNVKESSVPRRSVEKRSSPSTFESNDEHGNTKDSPNEQEKENTRKLRRKPVELDTGEMQAGTSHRRQTPNRTCRSSVHYEEQL
ncbi:unnamed protein product, partial [Mesorhabditis belari]|uniref:Uncharacterized protein n=1 Tax=Mesorhabditis belari TaxID=2138241 RepID=A0AAF3JAC5_9BILA